VVVINVVGMEGNQDEKVESANWRQEVQEEGAGGGGGDRSMEFQTDSSTKARYRSVVGGISGHWDRTGEGNQPKDEGGEGPTPVTWLAWVLARGARGREVDGHLLGHGEGGTSSPSFCLHSNTKLGGNGIGNGLVRVGGLGGVDLEG
jgi:hypothetical protein